MINVLSVFEKTVNAYHQGGIDLVRCFKVSYHVVNQEALKKWHNIDKWNVKKGNNTV